jgi:transcriptional regulator with GAF, ATPase, and Fis domain
MVDRLPRTTVTGARGRAGTRASARSLLHVVFPAELRRTFVLGDVEATVGRDPSLDGLLVDHGTISRRHARLAPNAADGAHNVIDLGSRNGTWIDGVRAGGEPRALISGSVLRLGDTLLVYEQEPADMPASNAPTAVSADALPGHASAVRALRLQLARAAPDPAPVLIIGETGTGKERIAHELHRLSGRGGRLVALNCAALSAQLVESQLFGHVKGAFTGADQPQPGLFRTADRGTLFLDEIGDLPPELQPKLLRALQEGEVLPVGATQPVRVDVRVVAATHRDLARAIASGDFREDLYARLALWELRVPALRERRVDLLDWVDRFHTAWAAKRTTGGAATALRFDADAAEALLRFAWPLNLRGVERLVHELGSAARAGLITPAALPGWLAVPPSIAAPATAIVDPSSDTAATALRGGDVPTREEFTRAFEELGGSVHALARRFGRDRRQIYRWLEAHGLSDRRRR